MLCSCSPAPSLPTPKYSPSSCSVGQDDRLERLAGILHGIQVVAESFHEGRLLQKEAVGAATEDLSHIKGTTRAGVELRCWRDAAGLGLAADAVKEEAAGSRRPAAVNELLGVGGKLRLRGLASSAPDEVQRVHRQREALVLQQVGGGRPDHPWLLPSPCSAAPSRGSSALLHLGRAEFCGSKGGSGERDGLGRARNEGRAGRLAEGRGRRVGQRVVLAADGDKYLGIGVEAALDFFVQLCGAAALAVIQVEDLNRTLLTDLVGNLKRINPDAQLFRHVGTHILHGQPAPLGRQLHHRIYRLPYMNTAIARSLQRLFWVPVTFIFLLQQAL